MKLLLVTLIALLGLVAGNWCEKKRTFYTNFNRLAPAYRDVDEAKAVCEDDNSCGGVGLDRIPYRQVAGGPKVYDHTIYLMDMEKVKKGGRGSYRYNSYVKC